MNLDSIARAYVRCVELDEQAQSRNSELSEEISVMRSELHALLMDSLREARIPFSDRGEAAHIAFNLLQKR